MHTHAHVRIVARAPRASRHSGEQDAIRPGRDQAGTRPGRDRDAPHRDGTRSSFY
eukprot:CAMPEP_0119374378 /NCGR_PEP_ID=MMETSP1334-20130426/30561_1 /TAXON_ID=127549 /ORGANISM="Calcidiscus leptoporus, Strain RCC1130" /LENGTH=54 /DNA_ID=CAMNT_0007392429 /DNA_START=363 /DNA_END=524 /DNA_ORIENTATION=-